MATTPGMEEIEEILDPVIAIPQDIDHDFTDFLPRKYLSVSQMVTFLKCPHSWYLRYVKEVTPTTSFRPFQGVQVHKAVERVLEEKLTTGVLPPLALATDTFSDEFDKHKGVVQDWEGEDPGRVKDTGISCAKIYYEQAAATATPVVVEKTFSTTIKTEDGKVKIPVLGRIDSIQVLVRDDDEYQSVREKVVAERAKLVASGKKVDPKTVMPTMLQPARIHDLKVTADKWGETDLANDLQFMLYAGVERVPDVQVDQLVKGRAKVPRPRYEVLTGVMTNAQVQHGFRVAQGVAQSIALGHFPPTDPSNWWCAERWCSVWRHCRGLNK